VTVALNGDGGDELFGGYERYRAWMVLTLLQRIKGVKGLMSGAQDIFRFLECLGRPQSRTFLNRLKRFLSVSQSNPDAAYTNWTTIFTGPEKSRIYSELMNPCKGLNSFEWTYRAMNLCTSSDEGEKLLCSDFHTYLPGDLLKKVDIASMAWSLECRSPFLDHRLISRAAALPMNMKANVFKNKIILKKLFENIIPKEIINAPKRGFGIPIDHWFRNDLKDWSRSVILDSPDMVWFNKKELNKLLDSHLKGQNTGFKIWSLVMLSLWCSKFKK
jgi:asparagine synthase (glutamine-hydrolysing)